MRARRGCQKRESMVPDVRRMWEDNTICMHICPHLLAQQAVQVVAHVITVCGVVLEHAAVHRDRRAPHGRAGPIALHLHHQRA